MASGPGWGIEAMMAVYRGDEYFVSRMQIPQSEDGDEAVGYSRDNNFPPWVDAIESRLFFYTGYRQKDRWQ